MIYQTSDLHLGDRFVFKVCHRPFKDLAEMGMDVTDFTPMSLDELIHLKEENKDEAYIN